MAGDAQIGALNVKLGIDTAAFSAGLKNAGANLNKFGVQLTLSLETVGSALRNALSAVPRAIKGSIDAADQLSKAGQKVGVTTEALSRLKYAADFSDVSLEQLTGGLGKLSKNMAEVATGKGATAQSAFMALGISVTTATGKLRGADEVMQDVAQQFSRMADGATKTAIAQQLFGKTGAELIPLLNEGRDGLKEFADESDRLNLTFSTATGKAAEAFNDDLTKLQLTMQGAVNKVTVAVLPALNSLSTWFVGLSPQAVALGTSVAVLGGATAALGIAAATATPAIAGMATALGGVASGMAAIAALPGGAAFLATGIFFGSTTPVGAGEDEYVRAMNARWEATKKLRDELASLEKPNAKDLYAGFDFGKNGQIKLNDGKPFEPNLGAFDEANKKAADAQNALNRAMMEGQAIFEQTREPLEQMQLQLDSLGNLLNQKAIDWDTYGRAVNKVNMEMASSTLGAIGQVTGALAGAFKDNKAFAVANAVVNTAEGITKALAQGGIFGFASAAAIGISGAAQVATILSAQPGSASTPSAAAAPAPPDATSGSSAGGVSQGVTINLAPGRYSAQEVAQLVTDIKGYLGGQGQQWITPHINGGA